jgi:dedicated sortase system histidine kinase
LNLRRQLLLVSLLLLSLPWAGCQFIREMEGAMRHGQEQSLQATAQAVAAVLGEQEELLYPNPARRGAVPDVRQSIYAHPVQQPLIVDGYGDGWEEIESVRISSNPDAAPLAVSYKAITRGEYLYLLLQVEDPVVIYHNPGLSPEPNGDRLMLRTWQHGRRQEYVIATAAPGSVRAKPASRRQPGANAGRIRGYWQDAVGGYTLELEIPLAYTGGRLGFYLMNVGDRAGVATEVLGNITAINSTAAPPWLIYSPAALQEALAPFSRQSSQIQVVDQGNWLIADLPATHSTDSTTADTFWLLQVIYRSILSHDSLEAPPAAPVAGKIQGAEIQAALTGTATNRRYQDANYATRTTLSAAAPIVYEDSVVGAVVVRQSGEQYLSLTDQAFSRLLGYSLLALVIGATGLLGYASLLSWRIGKLSRAASSAIQEDGLILDSFPRSGASDEIGELSRHYADLLDRLREYNDYLRTLSRKLSHELRTPIAVIQTSLENLEQAADKETQSSVYLQRARTGLQRLNRILTAMSEANRLEESIRNNQLTDVDLVTLLREVFEAYRGIYPGHALVLDIQAEAAFVAGVPDLIVQALDKLMDNAASFCPTGGKIELRLAAVTDGWDISVCNEGSALREELQDSLFEPMVSLRGNESSDVHLGLGLHIVRLIVDFHRGRVRADNLPEGRGVGVTIHLPACDGS